MVDVDPSQLERTVADLTAQLRDGLVAADILDLTRGVAIPKALATLAAARR